MNNLKTYRYLLATLMLIASTLWASEAEVKIQGFAFVPQSVIIIVGDSVKWTNEDNTPHTTTSGENGIPNGIWNSGILQKGATYTFGFDSAGTYPYFCNIHHSMTGTVIVNPKPDTGDTTTPAIEEKLILQDADLEISRASVEFTISKAAQIQLVIYNILGQEQAVLAQGFFKEGSYQIPRPQLTSGVYFARLLTDRTAITRGFTQVQ